MAPAVACATTLFLTAACWHQVSGESLFLSSRSSKMVPSGTSAALSEDGYQQVASLKNDQEMNEFISRVLEEDGLEGNTSYLQGLAPWYSGTRAVQSLASLRKELLEKPWVRRVSHAENASSELLNEEGTSSEACSTQCYTGHRAKAAWKEDKCHHQLCYACPECSRACLAKCYTGKRANAPWKKQKCHHQHCSGCPECDANQPAQVLNPSKGSEIRGEESHVKAEGKEKSTPPVAREAHRQTLNRLRNGSSGSKNTSELLSAPPTRSKSTSNVINHLDPSVAAATAANINPNAAAHPAFQTTKTSNKQIRPHAEIAYIKSENKQTAPERNIFKGSKLQDEDLHVKAEENEKGIPFAARDAQGPIGQEIQPSFDAKVAASVVADNTSTLHELDKSMQDTAQPSDSKVLPEVPSLLDKSKHVLEVLNKQVNTLKEQLTEAESESQKAVVRKKYEYEHILEQQIENSTSMAKANEQLGRETQKLREENVELRNRAMHLKAKGAQLHKQMLDLKANITLAQEYVDGVLGSRSNDSAALLVLRQLDEEDAALAKSKAHASALQQVTGALLQTTSRTASPDVLAVVRNLRERFEDLDREKAASMAALKQTFDEQFSKELQHQNVLMEEGYQLNIDRDRKLALRERLQAAVNHLEHTVSSLEQQIQGLQAYAERVSSMH